jgi:hypothetical protein
VAFDGLGAQLDAFHQAPEPETREVVGAIVHGPLDACELGAQVLLTNPSRFNHSGLHRP